MTVPRLLMRTLPVTISAGALIAFGIWTAWLVDAYIDHTRNAKQTAVDAALTSLRTSAELYYTQKQTYKNACASEEFKKVRRYVEQRTSLYQCRDTERQWSVVAVLSGMNNPVNEYLCVSNEEKRSLSVAPSGPSCDPDYSKRENNLYTQ